MAGGESSPFYEQFLYKQGWALFKQGRHDESLAPFLAVSMASYARGADVPPRRGDEQAGAQLLDDTLRVVSITSLDGAESIAGYSSGTVTGSGPPAVSISGDLY